MIKSVEVEALYPIDRIEVFTNGLVIHRRERFPTKHKPPDRKGIYEMSQKSRLKLTHLVMNCQVKFKSMFTLTYGDFLPPSNGKELKRQLNIFLNRFRKRYHTAEYLWFMEFTKKGRPHIHVITTVSPNDFDRKWLGAEWSKLTTKEAWIRHGKLESEGEGKGPEIQVATVLDEWSKSRAVHTHLKVWQEFYKEDGAMRYCLKYATKQEQKIVPENFKDVGRFWGFSSLCKAEPIAEMTVGDTMTEAQTKEIFKGTRVGKLPLIPKYVFQKNALEYFTKQGLILTEVFNNKIDIFVNKVEGL